MGLFEYFSVRLQEFSSGFFLRKRSFPGVHWSQVNPNECKWDFLNTFETGIIGSIDIHIFS